METNKEMLKKRIFEIIPQSKESAIRLRDISSYVGLTPRKTKELIKELREDFPICAKETEGGGYWLAECDSDIRQYIIMIKKHRKSFDQTIDTMQTHLEEYVDV